MKNTEKMIETNGVQKIVTEKSATKEITVSKFSTEQKRLIKEKIDSFRNLNERDCRIVWSYFGAMSLEFCCAYVKERGATEGLNEIFDLIELQILKQSKIEKTNAITRLNSFAESLLLIDFTNIRKTFLRENIEFIIPNDNNWPHRLRDLEHFEPIGLYVRGNVNLNILCQRSIAVVGSRNSTMYGKNVTKRLVSEFIKKGIGICSGGAFGIDITAHLTACNAYKSTQSANNKKVKDTENLADYNNIIGANNEAKNIGNVAFMASGVDYLTPTGNIAYFEDMLINNATFVSEYPLNSHPTSFRYLERNRLIAAFSKATILVEAAKRSGALNTVAYANKLSRPVGAVPGPIGSPTSQGSHSLIRNNQAVLVTNAWECFELAHDKFDINFNDNTDISKIRGADDVMRLFNKHKTVDLELVHSTLQLGMDECKSVCVQLMLQGAIKQAKKRNTWVKVN